MGNLKKYTKKFFEAVHKRDWWLNMLGVVNGSYIWLTNDGAHPDKDPRVLIVAGFHGEEIAGPWSILKWMETQPPTKVNVSFIPIVNPTGFDLGKRYNKWNEVTNGGFIHQDIFKDQPSVEGKILLKNSEFLKYLAKDGFLSLHEDEASAKSYLYTFENSEKPGPFSFGLRDEMEKFFEMLPDGEKITVANKPEVFAETKGGLIYQTTDFHDGGFEDYLWHEGIPRAAVTETAGKFKLDVRVKAGVATINKFIELCVKEKNRDSKT